MCNPSALRQSADAARGFPDEKGRDWLSKIASGLNDHIADGAACPLWTTAGHAAISERSSKRLRRVFASHRRSRNRVWKFRLDFEAYLRSFI
jgi:hypothetical protein